MPAKDASRRLLTLPHVQASKIRVLISRHRSPQAPEVPAAAEAGYPELTFDSVVGFYGLRDMPTDLKERIAADVRAVSADPAIAARLMSSGSALRVESRQSGICVMCQQWTIRYKACGRNAKRNC